MRSIRLENSRSALLTLATYVGWIGLFRLIALTLITYFLLGSQPTYQDIIDVFGAQELVLMAAAAGIFVALLVGLNPLTSTPKAEVITWQRIRHRFLPGTLLGLGLGVFILLALLTGGKYRFFGSLLNSEEGPLAFLGVLLRTAAIATWVYAEEFLFRHKLLSSLRKDFDDLRAILITSVLFCVVKHFQFDLGWAQTFTLFLASWVLALRSIRQGDFARGAGIWAGMLVAFQPLSSLPLFGSDFQGLLLIRYESGPSGEPDWFRWVTGGAGGPLSSVSLQMLLAVETLQHFLRDKKFLPKPKTP